MKFPKERMANYHKAIGYLVEMGDARADELTEKSSKADIQQNATQAVLVITAQMTLDILTLLNNQDG